MLNNLVKCVTYEAVDRLWVEPCGYGYAAWKKDHNGRRLDYLGNVYARDIVAAWIDSDAAQG